MPYSLPGIGSGVAATVYAGNSNGYRFNAYAMQAFGAAEGTVAGLSEVQIVEKMLLFNIYGENISKVTAQNYNSRGMDSNRDDYRYYLLKPNKAFLLFVNHPS